MNPSILVSTKKSLGVAEDVTAFDDEILMHINSAIGTLTQIGVGPPDGLTVEDATVEWSALTSGDEKLNEVPSYVHLKTKLLFDPPEIGFVLTAMKEMIEEKVWRINVVVDTPEPDLDVTGEFLDVDVIDPGYIY